MVSKGLVMVTLAAISGTSVPGCMQSTALPPNASISRAPTPQQPPAGTPTQTQTLDQLEQPQPFNRPTLPVFAANPWKPNVPERTWRYIVIHHTATSRGSVESINQTHRARKDRHGNRWLGIGYHFVIGNGNGMSEGAIEPTFRWWQQLQGAHAGDGDYNAHGIGIAMVGNFNEGPPSSAQLAAVKRLIGVLKRNYRITGDNVVGHGEIKATACPGKYFPMADVSRALSETSIGQHRPRNGRLRAFEIAGSNRSPER